MDLGCKCHQFTDLHSKNLKKNPYLAFCQSVFPSPCKWGQVVKACWMWHFSSCLLPEESLVTIVPMSPVFLVNTFTTWVIIIHRKYHGSSGQKPLPLDLRSSLNVFTTLNYKVDNEYQHHIVTLLDVGLPCQEKLIPDGLFCESHLPELPACLMSLQNGDIDSQV